MNRQAQGLRATTEFAAWKWCAGKCGRFLQPEAFYHRRWSGKLCVPCARYAGRKSRRRYYRTHAEQIRAQRRADYVTNRERECAYQRARYWRRKVAA